VLYDLATTLDSTKIRLIKIPISGNTEYLLIENRRWISRYETRYVQWSTSPGKLRPGVLVYHIIAEDDNLNNTPVHKLDADGMFTWLLTYDGGDDGVQLDDAIERGSSDPSAGYCETEEIFINGKQAPVHWTSTWWPNPSNPYGGGPYRKTTYFLDVNTHATDVHGDSLDLFQVGDVISPWSNPGSHRWDNANARFAQTTIGIEVKSFNPATQAYTLAIRVSNPEQLAPSKPQNLAVGSYNGYPKLTWSGNQESDVLSGGKYLISRRSRQGQFPWTAWSVIDSVSGTTTQYIDYQLRGAPSGINDVEYKIQAKDNTNMLSVYSDVAATKFDRWIDKKSAGGSQPDGPSLPREYSVSTAYPNPFNPSTVLKYQIPESGLVTLRVFDVLGREVATLVNEIQEAGYYQATFDAQNLSAGVYFASFRTTDELGQVKFSQINKLILAK
jgi:hypothetical protein